MILTLKFSINCKIPLRDGQEENPMPMTANVQKEPNRQKNEFLFLVRIPMMILLVWEAHSRRLHEQGHEVHVGYQTSGNIAVADDEALRFASFVCDYNDKFGIKSTEAEDIYKKAMTFLKNKKAVKLIFLK